MVYQSYVDTRSMVGGRDSVSLESKIPYLLCMGTAMGTVFANKLQIVELREV